MDAEHAKKLMEGLLFISEQPVTLKRIKLVLPDLDGPAAAALIDALNEHYLQDGHAWQVQEVAGGYQLVTDPQLAAQLKK